MKMLARRRLVEYVSRVRWSSWSILDRQGRRSYAALNLLEKWGGGQARHPSHSAPNLLEKWGGQARRPSYSALNLLEKWGGQARRLSYSALNLPVSSLSVICIVLMLAALRAPASGATNDSKLDGVPVRNTGHYATLDTDRGSIVIELYAAEAPKTVANFEKLSKDGFYNNLTFHRVEPGFVVQGGDPAGNGTGGPGYDLPAEISPTEKHLRGTLAMARKGDQVNPERKSSGSQFYICLEPASFLDGQYTVFGGVVEGMSVVDKIKVGDHIKKVTLSSNLPN